MPAPMPKGWRQPVCASRPCEVCGTTFKPDHAERRTCSRRCGTVIHNYATPGHRASIRAAHAAKPPRQLYPQCKVAIIDCPECGRLFVAHSGIAYCSDHCRRQPGIREQCERLRKLYALARLLGCRPHTWRRDLILFLRDRDGRSCGICGEDINFALRGTNRVGPVIDHKVSRANGGPDDESNLHVVHNHCNALKHSMNLDEYLSLSIAAQNPLISVAA
jgi:hypothetical protein